MSECEQAELETRLSFLQSHELKRPSPERIIAEEVALRHPPSSFSARLLESFEGYGYSMGEAIEYVMDARKKYLSMG